MEGIECHRQETICGRSRTSACPTSSGPPKLQIQATPQKDHQKAETGRTGDPAAKLSPGRGSRPRFGSWCQPHGYRKCLWRFCLRTSRDSPSTPSPTAAISGTLQGPPGPRAPGAGELRLAHSRNVPSGCFRRRRSWRVSVFPSTYPRGGWNRSLEWVPSPPPPSQPTLQPSLQQPQSPHSHTRSGIWDEC